MNIEDLMNVKVTSVSKKEQKLSRTASAVFVIGPKDIRDSGALNTPDLLRMVPGVDVAQITSNTWAIGVRGFNGGFSNKLLVLLDGRAVYTPTTGGVFWDVLNLPLDDIERIEVIRGPGGSAYELGYRTTVSEKLSIDIAAYYNHYKDQQTTEPGAPFFDSTPAPPHLILPLTFQNLMHGEAQGLEISTNWKITNRWSISPAYAFEEIHMHTEPTSQNTSSVAIAEGSSPRHSAQLRSRVDLSHGLEWTASAYFVDRLAAENIPSYARVDTQLIWKWSERGTLSLVGQNLQQDRHFEFQDLLQSIDANQAKRSAYAMIRRSFEIL